MAKFDPIGNPNQATIGAPLLDECDKAYRLYRNERKLPPLKRLPSETFSRIA